ncbi:tRNA pseudouridine(38-40) synthase TruA [Porticoccus sp. W117]|uniref:tRNA pseudouridine(38-40) synthase TruA n=1 Tax=Porticoccus sp. W117 TaxID=3054777 RepID=UPI002597F2B3|nr:tRNA pseudouridine(38-40) synthase TruA [Porticoccus sp. W117]MDM3871667.1 tRNA pseudouridine(38-40) synthase TruA [Porticoccus sp. W117]
MSEAPKGYQRNMLLSPEDKMPEGMQRIAAVVEYDGSAFCGWQRQSHSPSVQAEVERALSKVAAEPITVACAGRTDTGVHGTNQVIHFDTLAQREARNWILGANANLPDSIRVHWASPVSPQFHARFSATARTYRYVISNQPYRPALGHSGLTWQRLPLDEKAMQQGANYLLGERDFSSFRGAGCQSKTPNRNMHYVDVWRQGELVIIELRANAFVLHMCRNIAGALIAVGAGEKKPEWIDELMAVRDRNQAGITAPPQGLYLVNVSYPAEFEFPQLPPGPHCVAEPLRRLPCEHRIPL